MAWENRSALSSPCKYQAYIYFHSDCKEMSNNSQKNRLTYSSALKEANYMALISFNRYSGA